MEPEKQKKVKVDAASELRQDIVTGDWVVIATGRAKRPDEFKAAHDEELNPSFSGCPFCDPEIEKQEKPTLIYYREDGKWSLRVFPNKYPAFARGKKIRHTEEGPYFSMDGVGYHELIVTRDHERGLSVLLKEEVAEVLDAFRTRYLDLMAKKSVNYIMFIENHGKKAGASLAHPHWQMFAIPVISPGISFEIEGARLYKRSSRHCVYCTLIEWELSHGKRVVAENDSFVAIAPFASRRAFEVWILPKKHQPYFERITEEEEFLAGDILKAVAAAYHEKLDDIPYNMYLHTSPCDGKDYSFFHWHIELLPKSSVWAGFELGTGIEISTIRPEDAAEFLRAG